MNALATRFGTAYKTVALVVFSTGVLLLVFNVALSLFFFFNDNFFTQTSNPVSSKYGNAILEEVYPDLTQRTITDLLSETWSRPYVYEPFTQFKERPYNGEFVNVDENGFRLSRDQGPWPPASDNFNVFVFGGSTAFGYGVPDAQTVPSYLQEILDSRSRMEVRVYNFSRGFYYSTQERILFEKLLVSGFIPNMAIFIDGLNDFYHFDDEALYTSRLTHFVSGESKSMTTLLKDLPMSRLARALQRRLTDKPPTVETGNIKKPIYDKRNTLERVVGRYLHNMALIEAAASAYEVRPVFVWQPVPTYNYDLNYHPFAGKNDFGQHSYSQYGYQYMAEFLRANPLGENFFWCADIQKGLKEALYVDMVHYTANMSRILALNIVNKIVERDLMTPPRQTESIGLSGVLR